MKNLILIRHAKSSWDNPEWSDFDRPLNKRGLRDAPFMANLLFRKDIVPDIIISSTAKRALETAQFFCEVFNYSKDNLQQDLGIYERGSKYIINLLSKLDDNINTVFLIGHNPDITSLATYFSGEFFDNVPTCGIVGVKFNFDNWESIATKNGELLFNVFPRNYMNK